MTAVAYPRWRGDEPCMTGDPERFFPVTTEVGRNKAVSECRCCPSREPCLLWALHAGETGIWGGTGEKQRREMRKRAGISAQAPQTRVLDHARIRELFLCGWTVRQIAEHFDANHEVIRRIVRHGQEGRTA